MVDTSSLQSYEFTSPSSIQISISPMNQVLKIMTKAIDAAELALLKHTTEPTTEQDVVDDICAFRIEFENANSIMASTIVHQRLLQSPSDAMELVSFYTNMQDHFKHAEDIEMRFESLPSRYYHEDILELYQPIYLNDDIC